MFHDRMIDEQNYSCTSHIHLTIAVPKNPKDSEASLILVLTIKKSGRLKFEIWKEEDEKHQRNGTITIKLNDDTIHLGRKMGLTLYRCEQYSPLQTL